MTYGKDSFNDGLLIMELAWTIWALWLILAAIVILLALAFEKDWLANLGIFMLIVGFGGLFALTIIGMYLNAK